MDPKLKNVFAETIKRVDNKKRGCMYCNCQKKAIRYSHVLQKNGIIKQMSEHSHVVQLKTSSIFEIETVGLMNFKSIGVNEAYTFNGFCKEHDEEVFASIEKRDDIDLYHPINQALFAYRGLCQEIRLKEKAYDLLIGVRNNMPRGTFDERLQHSINGYICGLKILSFFKQRLELAINEGDLSEFTFETVQIPKIDICISVPLNIDDVKKQEAIGLTGEEYINKLSEPSTISFVNIFPKGENSYAVMGYYNDFPCEWTKNFLLKMKSGYKKVIFKELSDLIVLRLEFWAMSPSLFRFIPKSKIEEYKRIFTYNLHSHTALVTTDINLFEELE